MAVEIQSTMKPKNNGTFHLIEACDVDVNGTRLDVKLNSLVNDILRLYEFLNLDQTEPDVPDVPDVPDEPDEPTTVKLATPVIALYDENGKIEIEYDTTAILGRAILGSAILGNGGNTVKLDTPIIHLYDDASGEPDYSIVRLATPVIELVEIEDGVNEPDEPEEPDVPDEPTIVKLATPVIKLIDVTDGAVKLPFDNYGYINNDGVIVPSSGLGRKYSDLIAISDLANGPDGHCVQDFDIFETYPKVLFFSGDTTDTFIRGFTRTEIGDKDTLTVAEIKALAATVDGATYVAFNSDYEDEVWAEDCVYVVKGAVTVKPVVTVKLDTPIIRLEEVEPEEPIAPTSVKLQTPVIYLEAI